MTYPQELPAELRSDISEYVAKTGTSAEKLGLTTTSQLVELGRPAITALVRYWRNEWSEALHRYDFVRRGPYEHIIGLLKQLGPYAAEAPTMPIDRSVAYFHEEHYRMFISDQFGYWQWKNVDHVGRALQEVTMQHEDDGDEITVDVASPLVASYSDLRLLTLYPALFVQSWLNASCEIEDRVRQRLDAKMTKGVDLP